MIATRLLGVLAVQVVVLAVSGSAACSATLLAAAPPGCIQHCSTASLPSTPALRGWTVAFLRGEAVVGEPGSRGARCDGCQWAVTPACLLNDANGPDGLCGRALSCGNPAEDGLLMRIFFRRDAGLAWDLRRETCLGGVDDVLSPAQVGQQLREPFAKLVPRQQAGAQPRGVALINVPAIFRAGQPAHVEGTAAGVQGAQVRIEGTATFTWRFDPGAAMTTTVPGGTYPDKSVTFTYDRPGRRTVGLTTRWQGSYTVDGIGPFPIDQPVVQTTEFPLTLVSTRAELVAGG